LADLIDFEKLHPELALEPDVAVDAESSENDTPIGDKETLIVD